MWEQDNGHDVTSAFLGITTPVSELYDEIHRRGWTVKGVSVKDGWYLAQGGNPHGEQLEATGNNDNTAVGNLLLKIMRREWARSSTHLAAWSSSFNDRLHEIAEEYSKAKVYDPKAVAAWIEFASDNRRRAEIIQDQVHVEVVDEPDPYKSLAEMAEDVLKKKHISVSRANPHHPIWSVNQMVDFRLVHDILGHCVAGGDWSWHGLNRAFAAHAPLLSAEAQKALFTETLGQGAYSTVFRALSPQKVVFLDILDNIQEKENSQGHSGIHPSQTIVPTETAQIPKPGKEEGKKSNVKTASTVDPNDGFKSGVAPLPDNAYLWQRIQGPLGPTDPLDLNGLNDAAHGIDTRWHQLSHPDGTPDVDSGRQAVANAFRSVLLAPRKAPQAVAQHYQAVAGLPPQTNDPMRFWETFERHRGAHDGGRGYGLHDPQAPLTISFKQWIKSLHPYLDDTEVDETAKRELFNMRAEEEQRIAKDDPYSELSAEEIEHEVDRNLLKRLKVITKPKADQSYDFDPHTLFFESNLSPDIKPYPAYLAHHVKSMAGVGHYIDHIYHAAKGDIDRGGRGHHFRSQVLRLGLPGVGPKEASHAWMRLAPQTSQLGVISPALLGALDHKPEEVNDRDYYKHERELMAGRDAAGYPHVPLGKFGWGLHDHVTMGPAQHDDHRHLTPLGWHPHESIDWASRPKPSSHDPGHWWKSTQPSRQAIGKDWDRSVATKQPSHKIPSVHMAGAFSTLIPFFTHPGSGEVLEGRPGQSLMQHMTESMALSTPEIWNLELEAGKR